MLQDYSKVTIGHICTRTSPLEALKAEISIAANYKETFSIMHIDVSRAYFHSKAQRLVLVRLPVEDRIGRLTLKKEYVWHTGRSKQLGA